MAEIRKLVRVFLGSPGDLGDERKQARSVVDEFNNQLGDIFGCRVELMGWEDTVSIFGRPQATINRDLERCELFIGLMWKRWGTPPSVGGPYSSGFEEEFRTCIARRQASGSPEISLLFKEIGQELIRDPGLELVKVLAFKDELVRGKYVLFEDFSSLSEFERKFRRCLTNYVKTLHTREAEEASDRSQMARVDGNETSLDAPETNADTPLSIEGARFLRDLVTRTEQTIGEDTIGAVDIARFRLLSTLIRRHGNDEVSLGSHDANLLFQFRDTLDLGQAERAGLLSSGLTHLPNENVPLWHWLRSFPSNIPLRTVFGLPEERIGALRAMQLVRAELLEEEPFDRAFFLNFWLAEDSAIGLKVAALAYIAECGQPRDLQQIRAEIERNNNQTAGPATDAFIRINLRSSRSEALAAIYELQPANIAQDVLQEIFNEPSALDTGLLRAGLSHRSADVRRLVAVILGSRQELGHDIAEQLLSDADLRTRYLALQSLVAVGKIVSDDEAKKILVKPRQGIAASFGGDDEQQWIHFRRDRLRGLDRATLNKLGFRGVSIRERS